MSGGLRSASNALSILMVAVLLHKNGLDANDEFTTTAATCPHENDGHQTTLATGQWDEQQEDPTRPGSLISDLLHDDQNGDFTPGPMMRLLMNMEEPERPRELDTAAYIELSEDVKERLEHSVKRIDSEPGPSATNRRNADYPLEVALARGQADIIRALQPYRAANEPERPAIRVGTMGRPEESLVGNVNNYAPDDFDVRELESLFELSDQIRQRLADNQAESSIDPHQLKEINADVLSNYIKALAGIRLVSEHTPANPSEECAICRECPESEPWVELPCGHVYHAACISSWARAQISRANSCPECRRPFRLPFSVPEHEQM